jgi:hypothetical protein
MNKEETSRRSYTNQHPFYCDIDLHARSMYLWVLKHDGEILRHRNMKAAPEPFLKAIAPYCPEVGKNIAYKANREGVAKRFAEAAVQKTIEVDLARISSSLDSIPYIDLGRSPMQQDNTPALSRLASFESLENLLAARRLDGSAESMMTFEAFEVELGHAVRGLENELKAADLARYDVDADAVMVNGQEWRKCLANQPKTSLSASGPITVSRNRYRPVGGGKSICPLELEAGIIGGLHTPVVARQVADLMGHLTSKKTSEVFTELGISGPSSSTCDRLPKQLSAVWETHRVPWEAALREQEWVEAEASVVAVSLDGVMVPDKDGQREAKAKREAAKAHGLSTSPGGPASYRDVGCGTVTLYDEEATRLDTVRYGRAPESKKPTLTAQLDAELESILAVRPDLEVVASADGAEENWRYFDRPLYANATRIVDHGHACIWATACSSTLAGRWRMKMMPSVLCMRVWALSRRSPQP